MKRYAILLTAATLLPLSAFAQEAPEATAPASVPTQGDGQPDEGETEGAEGVNALAQADFINLEGESIGRALISGTSTGTLISLDISGLPAEQWVSFHIHENGECNPENQFESAGGHFNPDDVEHGYLSDTGPHAGDMPNQYVAADGMLRAGVINPLVMVDGQNDIIGLSLMIHDGEDDYASQPSGDAGDRIACAVIAEEPEDAQDEAAAQ